MYTETSNYKEMVAIAKEKGIATKNIKKSELIEKLNSVVATVTTSEESKRKGRPINPDSPRQKRLAEQAARKEAGLTVGRGRPANPESAWYKKQAAIKARKEAGELKLGRPVDPTSARQARLARKGNVPLGRPKRIIETVTETQAQ